MPRTTMTRGRRMIRWLAMTIAGSLVVVLGPAPARAAATADLSVRMSVSSPAEGPTGDAFYTPPSPLPKGDPGDVIWYRKAEPTSILGKVGLVGVDAWQILYHSTDALGNPDVVSGMVLLPKRRDPATLPLVGFAPGTQGLGDSCAPSRQILAGTEYESMSIASILRRGWAVAVTDYEGLGTPGGHTYMIGRSQGAALLDAVRAARGLPAAGLSTNSPIGLYGYSQGGGASGWAAQIQPDYAPELSLRGVVAGGTPADLAVVAEGMDGGLGFPFLSMSASGLDAAYPELDLDSYLNEAGRASLSKSSSQCLGKLMLSYTGKNISDYTTVNPLTTEAWQARIAEQQLGGTAPVAPVFLGHGRQDELIPYSQAERLKQDWCSAGASVTWKNYLGEHIITLTTMRHDALGFLADRFAGRPVTSSC